jgi:hypothetical protein
MAGKVKRSQFATFMNVGTSETPDYALIGEGVLEAVINYNPQTEEETYIHQDSGTTEITSYRPTMPVDQKAVAGDDVFDFLDGLRKARAVLDDAKTDIVNVWLYEAEVTGAWPAEKQAVSISFNTFGGPGGETAVINYTINFLGDPVQGTFNPSTKTFTPAAG